MRRDGQRKQKVFTPVTVRMVMNSQPRPDDICEFDGDPINDIILTGRLLRRVEEPMRTQFEINDNTIKSEHFKGQNNTYGSVDCSKNVINAF